MEEAVDLFKGVVEVGGDADAPLACGRDETSFEKTSPDGFSLAPFGVEGDNA